MITKDLSLIFSQASLLVFILVLCRVSGMLATAPFFSTFPIPMQAKAGLSALVAFMVFPMVMSVSHFQVPQDLITMTLLVFKEAMVGILIGFCAGLIFTGIQMSGQLLSIQMGLSVGDVLDPVTKQNVPIVGQFYLFLASMVFLMINGHHWLFSGIYDSYSTIPLGLNFEFSADLVEKIVVLTGQLFTIAFSVIMPVFAVLFITDIALAFVSKMMPQMNIFMVALPLKIYLGFILMIVYLPDTAKFMSGLITSMLNAVQSIFT